MSKHFVVMDIQNTNTFNTEEAARLEFEHWKECAEQDAAGAISGASVEQIKIWAASEKFTRENDDFDGQIRLYIIDDERASESDLGGAYDYHCTLENEGFERLETYENSAASEWLEAHSNEDEDD